MSRFWLIFLWAGPLAALYVMGLGSTGFLGPDEPRYASIGREMAETGDLVTPRLDGTAWFEKPPLLYWTTAAATRFGLRDEWAARLPMALISLAFLVFFYTSVARALSRETALMATTILATCAGWLAYMVPAVPDLPMAVTLGSAMLAALFDQRRASGWTAGALLGLAILSKGFVPLVLFAPVWLFAKSKKLPIALGAFAVAAPWYLLCWRANGQAFWSEFFWKHHVQRFFSSQLEHVQPFWFYVPVLLAGLFPWTPLLGLLGRRQVYEDWRVRFLGWWLVFAFVFFSMSKGKLPGYLLPLLPALAILMAVALSKAKDAQWWLGACAVLLILLPPTALVLPEALLVGLRRSTIPWGSSLAWAVPFLLAAGTVWWLAQRGDAARAVLVCGLVTVAAASVAKLSIFPALDDRVSVRAFWKAHQRELQGACLDKDLRRDWVYGLNYYSRAGVPVCGAGDEGRVRVARVDGRLALVR